MKAIILFSGGLDSTVMLALALANGRECHALSFDYGQRHRIELQAAQKIAAFYGVTHQIIRLDPAPFQKSRLTSDNNYTSYYVPARNTLFLSYATAIAEAHEAEEIYFGANAIDFQLYPDCRPAYIDAFQQVLNLATKQAVTGPPPRLIAPLIAMDKKNIVKKGMALEAPLEMTWSCYTPLPRKKPCKVCNACLLRQEAFKENPGQTTRKAKA